LLRNLFIAALAADTATKQVMRCGVARARAGGRPRARQARATTATTKKRNKRMVFFLRLRPRPKSRVLLSQRLCLTRRRQ